MAQVNLNIARIAKKDEFYTRLDDIAKELKFYKPYFKNKVVLCNCDDPYESNFFKYFALNFNQLELKKLIATCYDGSPVLGSELLLDFGETTDEPKKIAYKVEITEVKDYNEDGAVNLADVKYLMQNNKNVISILRGNGDFRSKECIELLKQADIVVTNPPFSLFREYVAQLVSFDKQFLIIGNTNALVTQELFKLFQEDKIRTGYTNFNVGMFFEVPDSYEKYHHIENGKKIARVSTSCWYTNLPVQKHKEMLDLIKCYNPSDYPKYDNYDAINVNTYTEIPCDYEGVIGVPITFLDKYNPEQFEVLGVTDRQNMSGLRTRKYSEKDDPKYNDLNAHPVLYENGVYRSLYTRILIRNKKPQKP